LNVPEVLMLLIVGFWFSLRILFENKRAFSMSWGVPKLI
jgi:hypothetical protein